MKKMLMCFDGPVVAYLSQMVPLARCFQNEFEIHCLSFNSVTYQFIDCIPFVASIIPLKYENGMVSDLSSEEGLTASTDYYYSNPQTSLANLELGKAELQSSVKEKLDDFDVVLLLYDQNYIPILGFFNLILDHCKPKCIGRVGPWSHNAQPYDPTKYIPKEAVESFGFVYSDDLLRLEYEWYGEHNPMLNIQHRSVALTCSGGCETYIPDTPNQRHYEQKTELAAILENKGFQVICSNRKETIRRQVFYSHCTYHLGVDSPMLWFYRCFKGDNKNLHFIQPALHQNMESQLGLQSMFKDWASPKEIAETFLTRLKTNLLV